MKNIAFATLAAVGAMTLPSAAFAQAAPETEITIGASAGVHDLAVDVDDAEFEDFDIDESGEIYGGFVVVDVPLASNLFAGVEGNAHFGTGPIDAEYGASARLGLRTDGGTKLYARGGYQWVDIDALNLVGLDDDLFDEDDLGIDTTEGDYLVGLGVDVPVGALALRANLDTIAFDTLRATVGVGLRF